jgi:hypothetical protein
MSVRRVSKPRSTTVEPLRERAMSPSVKPPAGGERRRSPQEIREERHDAHAKAICAGTFAERRQGRSSDELRAQQDELQRQWDGRKRTTAKAKPRAR